MPALVIACLGTFQVHLHDQPVTAEFESQKSRALLIYLAVEGDQAQPRERLAGLFWPDYSDAIARTNLRQALFNVRSVIDDRGTLVPFLTITRDDVQFNQTSDHWLDVAVFRGLLKACQAHPHRRLEACRPCLGRLRQATELYRGDFLEHFSLRGPTLFEEWAQGQQYQMREQALGALDHLASAYEADGELQQARQYALRQLALEPWREAAHRQLMRALARDGRREAALNQYEICKRVLAEELGVEPDAETRALYEGLRKDGKVFLPVPIAHTPLSNLPAPLTSFVGRESEVTQIIERLQHPDCRLLTLTGPGGVGKTRLAQEGATKLREAFEDGLFFVALASIHDPALVISSIAQTLEIKELPSQSPFEGLRNYLRHRRMLLVLDNFEQVTDAAPQVTELLRVAPHLKVLITSRETLHVYGEHKLEVLPLTLPDLKQLPPSGTSRVLAIAQSAAVILFMQRSQAVKFDFALTPENATGVAEVCTQLDGLPLALELAAARSEIFSPAAMATQLQDRLAWLIGGPRDVAPRQQTLYSTIEWSYQLLSAPEQRLLAQLAVFVGGCTSEAAEEVAVRQSSTSSEATVRLGLASLVNKNLLRENQSDGGEVRFIMLETIREYALERMAVSGEADYLRRRHASYFLQWLLKADPQLQGADQALWLKRVEAEHDNFRAALEWSQTDAEAADVGLQLAAVLWRFWWMRGYLSEGRKWLTATLARTQEAPPTLVRAKALNSAAILTCSQGDYAVGRALAETSLSIFRSLDNKLGVAYVLNTLGVAAKNQGDFDSARRYYEESLALFQEIGDQRNIALALGNLGTVAQEQGDHVAARRLYDKGLTIRRALGDQQFIGILCHNLGELNLHDGDTAAARALLGESLVIRRELGDRSGTGSSVGNLGLLDLKAGDYLSAHAQLQESLAIFLELREKARIVWCLEGLAKVADAQVQPRRAGRLFGAADALRRAYGAPLPPIERADYEHHLAAVRAQLGADAFSLVWAEGQAMTLEQAVDYSVAHTNG